MARPLAAAQATRPASGWLAALLLALAALPGAHAHAQSPAHGQLLLETRCVACHSLDSNRVGPALRGVAGRAAGRAPGYSYSEALAGATHVWDVQSLRAWLTNPEDVLPGQRMNYRVEDAGDREDVVAYLLSLSRQPQ